MVDVPQRPRQEHDDVCVVECGSVVGGFGRLDDLDNVILDGSGDGLCHRQAVSERFESLVKLGCVSSEGEAIKSALWTCERRGVGGRPLQKLVREEERPLRVERLECGCGRSTRVSRL